jgi:Protein of unknown function (DUF3237)
VPASFEEMSAAVVFIKVLELTKVDVRRLFETLIPIRTRLALFRTNSDDIERIRPMATRLRDDLPDQLREIRTRPLFVMRLAVRPLQIVGGTPGVYRRIGVVPGGTFDGERLSGEVLEGGNDWQAVREDGSTTLDARLVLKTTNGALIGMTYHGVRHGPAGVIAAWRGARW